ncbi:MAG: hypothetical protein LBF66_01675 [Holosporales bacterium]|nr:hypothetical protein [Holosporales bacterium]
MKDTILKIFVAMSHMLLGHEFSFASSFTILSMLNHPEDQDCQQNPSQQMQQIPSIQRYMARFQELSSSPEARSSIASTVATIHAAIAETPQSTADPETPQSASPDEYRIPVTPGRRPRRRFKTPTGKKGCKSGYEVQLTKRRLGNFDPRRSRAWELITNLFGLHVLLPDLLKLVQFVVEQANLRELRRSEKRNTSCLMLFIEENLSAFEYHLPRVVLVDKKTGQPLPLLDSGQARERLDLSDPSFPGP